MEQLQGVVRQSKNLRVAVKKPKLTLYDFATENFVGIIYTCRGIVKCDLKTGVFCVLNLKCMTLCAASIFSINAHAQQSTLGIRPDYFLLQFGQSGNFYFAPTGYGASTKPILLSSGNRRIGCLTNEIGRRIRTQGIGNVLVNCRLDYTAEMVIGDFGNSYKNTVHDIDFSGCIKYNTQGDAEPLVQNLPAACAQ